MSVKPRSTNVEAFIEDGVDPVSEALDRLPTSRYSVSNGTIVPLTKNEMTRDEWNAITYLVEEWTYFFEPYSAYEKASAKYSDRKNEEEEVYVWSG